MKIIGYRHNGIIYGVATHLGGAYISHSEINVYFDEKELKEDFDKAIRLVTGRYFFDKTSSWNLSVKRQYRGGKVFICKLNSPRCEFDVSGKRGSPHIKPTDSTRTVALRHPFKLK